MAENAFADALQRRRQISITVTGRRTGRAITVPVWFVRERNALWLLPVYGSQTQWYRNLQANRGITIRAGRERGDFRARLLREAEAVGRVVQGFRDKYSPEQIKRWYKGLDVAVQVALT